MDHPARTLFRLLAIVGAFALVIAASVAALVAVADDAVHHSATAQELPLPPISSKLHLGSTVYARDGHTVLAVLQGPQTSIPTRLSQVSPTLTKAVLDTEDHGFYVHGGIDVSSVVRAALNDSSGGGIQGGSTIAQQLAKQLYLNSARTLSRKVKEALLAYRLEHAYTKNQILQAYLNTIYLGEGAYGVEAAARTYFGESAGRLNLAQAALLAGMIQDPNGYNPILQPAAARERRSEVLQRMVVDRDITPAQASAAGRTPLPTRAWTPQRATPSTNYYLLQVEEQLLGPGSPLGATPAERYNALYNGGLKIYTNFDPHMQALAQQAAAANTPPNQGGFEEGLVSIDPKTGAVRALVGGAPGSQFDVVTQGLRQPGSGFKLFTLLAALREGFSVKDTVDSRAPCAIKFAGDNDLVAKPINNDTGPGGGVIDLVKATADSVNCAYIRLAHQVGLPAVITMARELGISEITAQDQYPSMVIGSIAVRPIEMAAAYAAVADGGVYHPPTFVTRILDVSGGMIYKAKNHGRRVFSTQIAAQADQALEAVVQSGTGTGASVPGHQVAGKTGTTEQNVDAWFNGFTPQLETTVWMGNVRAEIPINFNGTPVYGADYPAATWRAFDAPLLYQLPAVPFPAVNPHLVSAPRYITSPQLVADDVLDHNRG